MTAADAVIGVFQLFGLFCLCAAVVEGYWWCRGWWAKRQIARMLDDYKRKDQRRAEVHTRW